jgi:hypothetical protein
MERCLKHIAQNLWKTRMFSSVINVPKGTERTWKVVKEAAIRKSKHPIPHFFNKFYKDCGIIFVLSRSNGQPGLLEILTSLLESVRRTRSTLLPKSYFVHHNAPFDTTLCVKFHGKENLMMEWKTSLFVRFISPVTFSSLQNWCPFWRDKIFEETEQARINVTSGLKRYYEIRYQ